MLVPVVALALAGPAACVRGASSSDTPAGADASSPTSAADDPSRGPAKSGPARVVAVRQHPIAVESYMWSFDPSGRWVAAEIAEPDGGGYACGVWDLASGALIRVYGTDGGEGEDGDDGEGFDPCLDWPAAAEHPVEQSTDGRLLADFEAGALVISSADGHELRRIRACHSCAGGTALATLAWAPSGHQLVTSDGGLVEVWDADTGERLRSEALGVDGELEQLQLSWNAEAIVVVTVHAQARGCAELDVVPSDCWYDHEDYGDDEDEDADEGADAEALTVAASVLSSFTLAGADAPMLAERERFAYADTLDLVGDPGGRWLAFTTLEDGDLDSVSEVHVLGTGGRTSKLGRLDDGAIGPERETVYGYWRTDASSTWVEVFQETVEDPDEYSIEVGWRAIVAEPDPGGFAGVVLASSAPEAWAELEVFGVSSGAAALSWEGCDESEECRDDRLPVPDGCELLDVSPSLALALVDCGNLRLIEAGGRGAVFAELPFPGDADWRWGRGSWLAVFDGGGRVGVVALGGGRVMYERRGVVAVPNVPLAIQRDLLALRYPDRLELIAGSTGAVVATIADPDAKLDGAALSPEGDRLALVGGGRGKVLDLAAGAVVSEFVAPDAYAVAFRQDGKLFYGDECPTHVVDPETGALVAEIDPARVLDCMPDTIDPSWRWMVGERGRVTRTLDFRALELGPNYAFTDTGLYAGDPRVVGERYRFRLGDDPNLAPTYTLTELEPWLHRPELVRAFFAGEPLDAPVLSAEDHAKLAASHEPRADPRSRPR